MNDGVFHPLALEFHRARLGGMRAAVEDLIRHRPPSLLTDIDSWTNPLISARLNRGIVSAPIYQISGRAARYDDFDQLLAPAERRWQPHPNDDGIGRGEAHQTPIELYRIGATYFVKDGNRRVAEARARGQLFLLAHVTECLLEHPLNDAADAITQLLLDEYHEFQAATSLAQLRPAQRIECAALGGYAELARQIEAYRAGMEVRLDAAIERHVAVTNWCDTMYMPIASAIHRQGLLRDFPRRSETDLYLWAANRSLRLDDLSISSGSRQPARVESIMRVIADLQRV